MDGDAHPQATSTPAGPTTLRTVFERLPTGIAMLDPQGRLTLANRVLERMVGQNRLDLIGESLPALAHPDDVDACRRAFEFFVRDGTDRQIEVRLARPADQPVLWCLIHLGWVRATGDEPTEIIASFQDVTERKTTEQRLHASAERYRLLVERANDIIFNIDLNGVFTFVNRTGSRLMKYPPERLIGMHFLDLIREDYRADAARFYFNQLTRRVPSTYYEFPAVTRDGKTVWLGQAVQLILDGTKVQSVQAVARDITAQKEAEEALRASEQQLRAVISNAPIILWASDLEGRLTLCEGQGLAGLDLAPETLVGRPVAEVFPDADLARHLRRALGGESLGVSLVLRGQAFDAWYSPLRGADGQVAGVIGVAVDITEQRRLQDRMHELDKMESIGLLAGGVAHDFNNQLTAILGYAEMLVGSLDEGDPRRADAREIVGAGRRAAAVTDQLLAFGRRQPGHPRVVDLSAVVGSIAELLRRSVRDDVDVDLELAATPDPVRVDPLQIEHVVMNLVLNARDAMPGGGLLTVMTRSEDLDGTRDAVPAGRYTLIEVTDTGHGMDEETRLKVFDPFFTTKDVGKGTGLGLASAYGIVTESDGFIRVSSAPGQGSSFRVYFPVVDAPIDTWVDRRLEHAGAASGGHETVLVVEDNPTVRALASHVLTERGYRVLIAAHPDDAVALATAEGDRIDLLLTDVVMPGMSGTALARIFHERWPAVRIVYTTGYTEDETIRAHRVDRPHLLEKPFLPSDLLRTVRAVLDAPVGSTGRATPHD